MELWLLRHARVELAAGLCYGRSDVPADLAHTAEAAATAAALVPTGLPVWVSGLGRARQLAKALHSLRPDLGTPRTDARLNEMDFGQWELQPWNAIPRSAFDTWMADFSGHAFGGVESTQQVIDRVAAALTDLKATAAPQALWVTHAGVIRAVQYLATHGGARIRNARQWPAEAPTAGAIVCLQL